jgi:hypothetical protein
MPRGLFEVLERALARDPNARFPTAMALSEALTPFDPNPAASRAELGALVRWVQSAPSTERMQAVQPPAPAPTAMAPPPGPGQPPPEFDDEHESDRQTSEYAPIPSYVTTANGARFGPWAFARLVEAVATGQVGRGDFVDFMGRGLAPLATIEELARFSPLR